MEFVEQIDLYQFVTEIKLLRLMKSFRMILNFNRIR